MGEDNLSFKVVEDRFRKSSFQSSRPRQEDTPQAERTLKRKIGGGGGVRTFTRLRDRTNVSCMADRLEKEGWNLNLVIKIFPKLIRSQLEGREQCTRLIQARGGIA